MIIQFDLFVIEVLELLRVIYGKLLLDNVFLFLIVKYSIWNILQVNID